MNVVAFTPIRLNSKRLPNKNLLMLGGKPLLNWAVEAVDRLGIRNFIYTSQPEKLKPYLDSGHVELAMRSISLDADDVKGHDIYDAFVNEHPADVYILYHVTSPFVHTWYFETALQAIEAGYDSAFSVQEHRTFAHWNGKALNYFTPLPRTQDLKPVYTMTSGFFVFTRQVWEKFHCRIGVKHKKVIVDQKAAIDIDYQEDFLIATALLNTPVALKEQP